MSVRSKKRKDRSNEERKGEILSEAKTRNKTKRERKRRKKQHRINRTSESSSRAGAGAEESPAEACRVELPRRDHYHNFRKIPSKGRG